MIKLKTDISYFLILQEFTQKIITHKKIKIYTKCNNLVSHPGLTKSQCSKIESIQKRAIKIILGTSYTTYDEGLARLELTTLESRRHFLTMDFGHKCLSSDYHRRLLLPFKENHTILPNTRLNARRAPNTQLDLCPQMLTTRYKNSFVPYFVSHFNN